MTMKDFWGELQGRTRRYHLVHHPFHESWITGLLSRWQLHRYAAEFQYHVASYRTYFRHFESRLAEQDDALRSKCHSFRWRELSPLQVGCSSLWLRFLESVQENDTAVMDGPSISVSGLIQRCLAMVRYRSAGEVFAAMWAHESCLIGLVREQSFALVRYYNLAEYDVEYFQFRHRLATVTREFTCEQLNEILIKQPYLAHACIRSAEELVFHLWSTLDSLDRRIRVPEGN